MTDKYLEITRKNREIIGRPLFDVFPDNPSNPHADGVKNLTNSLIEVIRTKKTHWMAVQRYDTQLPGSDEFEVRYWSPSNIPVLNDAGDLDCIIHAVEEVTDRVQFRQYFRKREQRLQQQISDAITTTQEMERMEISKELHDNINQILLTSRLYLGRALEREIPDKHLISTSLALVENAIDEIKGLAVALLKTSSEEENLMEAIERLLNDIVRADSIHIHKSIEIPDELLIESKVKVAIFRIIQEQLANVMKHSEAKNLYINMEFDGSHLILTIKDDGVGFLLTEIKKGLGFQNMKSRVAVMDGVIHIQSQPGDGCTIEVNIPLTSGKPELPA